MVFGSELIIFLVIIFVASLIRSTFGFGDALIAMPLLAIFLSIKTVTPIIAFIGFFMSIVILAKSRNQIKWKTLWQLVVFSIIGIPFGVLFLKGAHEETVKLVLAIILIIFPLYQIFQPKVFRLKNDKSAFAFGLISGMFGGAYNTNGPPIIIYGTLRGWPPEEFRIIVQGIFLPTNFFIIISHGIAGLWTHAVFNYFLISLPVIMLAIFFGVKLNKFIHPEKFNNYIYIFLIIIGLTLLLNIYF